MIKAQRLATAILIVVAIAVATMALTRSKDAHALNCYSSTATVGTTSSTLVAAGGNYQTLTISNTDATKTVYVSFTTPATTTDLPLPALAVMSFRLSSAPQNAIYAVGSGASINVAIIGCRL